MARSETGLTEQPGLPSGPATRKHNLPELLTSFVGRQREAEEVRGRLGATRLLTLVGPGGVGKTRLALQVAQERVAAYAEGVWFVELAALTDPNLLAQAVARAVGIAEQPGRPLVATLVDGLHDRGMLVVLDNCEHLIQACAELAEVLLGACAGVRILATSREPLRITGEVTFQVPPLSLVAPEALTVPEQVLQTEAVRLLVERARAVRDSFDVSPANAVLAAQVCQRLDGLPLAIELAAARLGLLSLGQLDARLEDRFHVLTRGSRTAPPRQQTLQSVVDWSYELLDERERTLLRRLSVFVGSWTIEAAEAVCTNDAIDTQDVLELLGELVAKSLVLLEGSNTGELRYRLLETIREYAAVRLREADEVALTEHRHRDWYLQQAERAEADHWWAGDWAGWSAWLDREQENFRTALGRTLAWQEGEKGLRLGAALWPFWITHASCAEGRAWLDRLLALPDATRSSAARGRALNGAADLAHFQGAHEDADRLARDALAMLQDGYDRQGCSVALFILGLAARARGHHGAACAAHEEAVALAREIGNWRWEAVNLANLGLALDHLGETVAAMERIEEALAIGRSHRSDWVIGQVLLMLGRVALGHGDLTAARAALEEGLRLRPPGFRNHTARALADLGHIALLDGDHLGARGLFGESLAICRNAGDRDGVLTALEGFAVLAVAEGRFQDSLRLAGCAAALRAAHGAATTPLDRQRLDGPLGNARRELGPRRAAVAELSGQHLSLDQAIAQAAANSSTPTQSRSRAAADPLTRREREVARLIAQGCSTRDIAERLVITEGTTRLHVEHILSKLDLHSRAQLATWVTGRGLLGNASDG